MLPTLCKLWGPMASSASGRCPVWGGAKTRWTLSAHRCEATALRFKTRGFDVEEVSGLARGSKLADTVH